MDNQNITTFSIISLDGDFIKYKIKYAIKITEDIENGHVLIEIIKIINRAANIESNKYNYSVSVHSGNYTIDPKRLYNTDKDEINNYTKEIIESFNVLEMLLGEETQSSTITYINMVWRLLILLKAYKNDEPLTKDMVFGTKILLINDYANELDSAFDTNNKYETNCNVSLEDITKFLEAV